MFPKEGVPAVTEPVAILKTTRNPAAAKAFVDFILSDDGQNLAGSQGYVPAKAGIANPAWLPANAEDQSDAARHRRHLAGDRSRQAPFRRDVRRLKG